MSAWPALVLFGEILALAIVDTLQRRDARQFSALTDRRPPTSQMRSPGEQFGPRVGNSVPN